MAGEQEPQSCERDHRLDPHVQLTIILRLCCIQKSPRHYVIAGGIAIKTKRNTKNPRLSMIYHTKEAELLIPRSFRGMFSVFALAVHLYATLLERFDHQIGNFGQESLRSDPMQRVGERE